MDRRDHRDIEFSGDMVMKMFDMYRDYMHELWTYTGYNYGDEEIRGWYDNMVSDPTCHIVPVVKFGKEIGFVIYQDIDWIVPKYIIDAYIIPEERRQGRMTAQLESMIASMLGYEICLYIIRKNTTAYDFWTNFFSQRGYAAEEGRGLPDFEDDSECDFLIFRKH